MGVAALMFASGAPPNEGMWAAALLTILTAIGGGAWKILSDSSSRVDTTAREQRDRLADELDRTRADLAASKAEIVVARHEAQHWQGMYLSCRMGDPDPTEDSS